jgi:hypothetical protein
VFVAYLDSTHNLEYAHSLVTNASVLSDSIFFGFVYDFKQDFSIGPNGKMYVSGAFTGHIYLPCQTLTAMMDTTKG